MSGGSRPTRWPARWDGEVDCCINAMTLAGAWLGADVTDLAQWFLDHRLPDGGWNCEWTNGSTRSSFHSTLNTVKGLLAYEELTGGTAPLRAARQAGERYLLERRLMYRASTGALVGRLGDTFCVSVPLALQCAQGRRLLQSGDASRWRNTGSASDRRREPHSTGAWRGWHVESGASPSRTGLDPDGSATHGVVFDHACCPPISTTRARSEQAPLFELCV